VKKKAVERPESRAEERLGAKRRKKSRKKNATEQLFFQTQQSFRSINFGTARSLHAAALERIKYAFSRLVFPEFKIRQQWRVTEMVKILL
jgi:hypothetical protein